MLKNSVLLVLKEKRNYLAYCLNAKQDAYVAYKEFNNQLKSGFYVRYFLSNFLNN